MAVEQRKYVNYRKLTSFQAPETNDDAELFRDLKTLGELPLVSVYQRNATYYREMNVQISPRRFHKGEITGVMAGSLAQAVEESPRGLVGLQDLVCYMTGGYVARTSTEIKSMIEACKPELEKQFAGKKDLSLVEAVFPLLAENAYQPKDVSGFQTFDKLSQPASATFIDEKRALRERSSAFPTAKERGSDYPVNRTRRSTLDHNAILVAAVSNPFRKLNDLGDEFKISDSSVGASLKRSNVTIKELRSKAVLMAVRSHLARDINELRKLFNTTSRSIRVVLKDSGTTIDELRQQAGYKPAVDHSRVNVIRRI